MSVTEKARATSTGARARGGRVRPGGGGGAGSPGEVGLAGETPLVAPPPKLRRRPLLVAGSVVAVCLGALVSAYAYSSTSNAHQVLAVVSTVHRGEVIKRS